MDERLHKALQSLRGNSISELKLEGINIGVEEAKAISKVLLLNTSLSELVLGYNNLGDEGVKEISKALFANTSLSSLHLFENNIGVEGALEISKSLLSNTSLSSLDLMGNKIGDEGVKEISKSLLSNTSLTSLSLRDNHIGEEGAKEISKSLLSNTSLSLLNLFGNKIGDEGALEISKSLLTNTSISSLNLAANYIGAGGALEISRALLSNTSLSSLTLTRNHIGAEGTKEISRSLLTNTSLSSLHLEWNNIGDEGVKEISKSLLSNAYLTDLNLTGNKIGDEGALEIGKSLLTNTSISSLNLAWNNCIGEKTFKEIEKRLTPNYIVTASLIERVKKEFSNQNNLLVNNNNANNNQNDNANNIPNNVNNDNERNDSIGSVNIIPLSIEENKKWKKFHDISKKSIENRKVIIGEKIKLPNEIITIKKKKKKKGKKKKRERIGRIDGVEIVRTVPVIKLMEDYHPPHSCFDHIQDLPLSLNGLGDIHLIAEESKRLAEDRLSNLPLHEKKISIDEAIAIAAYTFDLGFHSNTEDGSDNLFVILNNVLRERNSEKMIKLKPYLFYLMSGLTKLEPVKGTVYRGIPSSSLAIIKEKYSLGLGIHWSGFTSTTTSLITAQRFAKENGVIFRIKVITGRSVINYSSFQNENEILLSPNWRAFVSGDCHLENDGYYYVDLVERVDSTLIF